MYKVYSLIACLVFAFHLNAQIVVDIEHTADEFVTLFLGADSKGVKVLETNIVGNPWAIGTFNTFSTHFPIKSGIVLSTGRAHDVDGPNQSPHTGTALFELGDEQLENAIFQKTADAIVLEFAFVANTNEVSFIYSFASEEYPEYVNKGVNDAFAFFVEGYGLDGPTNIALIPGTNQVVSVDNINAQSNEAFFISNPRWDIGNPELRNNPEVGEISYNCEFDGITTALEAKVKLTPYQPYIMKIVIADVGDNIYDSGVFLEKNSFKNTGTKEPFVELLATHVAELSDSLNLIDLEKSQDTLNIISNIQFKFNSSDIVEEYYTFLDKLANQFVCYFDMEIAIEGHADDIGDKEYNLLLSEQRAKQVYDYLVNRGVEANRLTYEGKGDAFPIAFDATEEARQKNRRVEFMIVNK